MRFSSASDPPNPVKIVLVNPPSPPEFRVSRGLMGGFGMAVNPGLLYPPIELAHVASVLEAEGHEVVIHDGDARELDLAGSHKAICSEKPDFVCLDSSSTSLERDLELAGLVRRDLGIPVGILGSQVSYTPDEIFEGDNVDVVIRGEPEHIVRDLAQRLAANEDFKGVAGASWRAADGQVVHEAEREKINALDDLPLPARHLLDNQAYRFPGIDGAITTVKSSRGCPLNCSFCGYTLAQGLRFRFRSPEHVLAELEDLYRVHGIRHVVFRDPIFSTKRNRVLELCQGMLDRGLDIEWQCETAVKVLDRELLEIMAKAGCRHISLGVESGNEEIQRKHCGAKLLDHAQAKEVFVAARDFGIETRAFCMIGFPEETESMVDETLRLVEHLDPDQVQFCAVTAYPGTPLYEMLSDGRDFDYAVMTGYRAMEGNEHMTAAQIEAKIKKAYRSFYLRPHRLAGELAHPRRLISKLSRYLTLFKERA
ncbi:MAG: anaerobic magnesium-protoporphyrin IX monomethyl ester cyclase [Candidatus Paceibacteria bacterium]|jgi:anaerobic magnesium-protoporphyrin IX monomethyl ester cyclase